MFNENIERFGEIRELLQGAPSKQAMERLVRCVLDVELLEQDEVEARWLPYIQQNIERWYTAMPYKIARDSQFVGFYHHDALMWEPHLSNWALAARSSAVCWARALWTQKQEVEPPLLEAIAQGKLDRLEGLTLGRIADGEAVCAAIGALPKLRGLSLQERDALGPAACEALLASAPWKRLESLELYASPQEGFAGELARRLSGGPLRHVLWSLPGVSGEAMRSLLSGCPQLESLALSYMQPAVEIFEGLPAHAGLRALDVEWMNARDVRGAALCEWDVLSQLEVLTLSGCVIGEEGAAMLARRAWSAQLRVVKLCASQLGPGGVNGRLCDAWRGVEELQLMGEALDEDAVAAIVRHPWPRLTKLDLSSSKLDADRIRQLARGLQEGRFPALRELSLGDNEVGEGAMALLDALPAPVEELWMMACSLDDALGERIAAHPRLKTLKRVGVTASGLSEEVEARVMAAVGGRASTN